ncbi:hypothetical protein [Vibrio vulnificus]|uniref:hypothetical protein n=1 Tax=Vibrio vulnificus TaxID=672 RepID=UPI0005F25014|nr:hypothetical protein [Vibrio vulnificus]
MFVLIYMSKIFYHGSDDYLPPGTKLRNCVDYEGKWGAAGFYRGLEYHRPNKFTAHKDSVFLVKELEDLEYAGGGEEYTFLVVPKGGVTKHDMYWSTKVTELMDSGFCVESDVVKEAALKYWYGEASEDPAWEYMCKEAIILRVFDWDVDSSLIKDARADLEQKKILRREQTLCPS